jgi:hypothetical protein
MDQGEEETWDTMGGATERSRSPGPTTEATVPEAVQQAAVADEPRASTFRDYWSCGASSSTC